MRSSKTSTGCSHVSPNGEIGRRELLGGLAALASMAAAGLLPSRSAFAAEGEADLVVRNGRVLILGKDFGQAEAIAVREGRVLAVGSDREIRRTITRRTREI